VSSWGNGGCHSVESLGFPHLLWSRNQDYSSSKRILRHLKRVKRNWLGVVKKTVNCRATKLLFFLSPKSTRVKGITLSGTVGSKPGL
jgi:hypothetical protein